MDEKMNLNPEGKVPAPKSRAIYIALGVVIVAVALIYLWGRGASENRSVPAGLGISQNGEMKVFEISAIPFQFSVKEIRVKKGDRVRINLTTNEGLHDWVVDEFSAKTERLGVGQTGSVEFTADKIGTFEYYCSVGTHRQMGMVGKLIVE